MAKPHAPAPTPPAPAPAPIRQQVLLPMIPTSGRGKELMEFLRKELGIPDGVRWFEVRFAMSEPVKVTLEYIPRNADDGTGVL